LGQLTPVLSVTYPLADVGSAARLVQTNGHLGKVGVLCLAPRPGLGVTDPDLRQRIGEDRLNPLRSQARKGEAHRAQTLHRDPGDRLVPARA
jgi:crotonyl-CoA reductase